MIKDIDARWRSPHSQIKPYKCAFDGGACLLGREHFHCERSQVNLKPHRLHDDETPPKH
jgi:hypothetical protein